MYYGIIVTAVNSQPKQLTDEESRYLRHQLQDVRDRINQLLDKLDNNSLACATDIANSVRLTAGRVASTASSSNSTGSFDPLTRQKFTTATGSADTGELSFIPGAVLFTHLVNLKYTKQKYSVSSLSRVKHVRYLIYLKLAVGKFKCAIAYIHAYN